MKIIITLNLLLFVGFGFSQNDTLLFENFEAEVIDYIFELLSNGDDDTWLNFDQDGLPDGSGQSRPGNWFLSSAFANADEGNTVLISNSWTNNTVQSVENYLITPPIQIVDANAVLTWKSAPRQTPRFLDGYVVVAQVGTNIETNFTDTLIKYAEFISGDSSGVYSDYVFSAGIVHGADGEFVEDSGDIARAIGVLRPNSISLAQYEGQTVYFAFVHNSTDDNLISIDDILITGTSAVSAQNLKSNKLDFDIFPNPAIDVAQIKIDLPFTTGLRIEIFSIDGKLVKAESKGVLIKGTHYFQLDVSDLATGVYNVVFQANNLKFGKQLIKQ